MNQESLYHTLLEVRKVGNQNMGNSRNKILSPVLNEIIGNDYEWDNEKCALCLKALIEEYSELDHQDLLLSSSGLIEPYTKISLLSKRLSHYYDSNQNINNEIQYDAFRRRELGAIKSLSSMICQDYHNNPDNLRNLVNSIYHEKDTPPSGSVTRTNDGKGYQAPNQNLKTTEKITNIILGQDDLFVGRASVLEKLYSGFKNGNKVQVLGGAMGRGKTRVALEYTRLHHKEYQIICWIDATSKNTITSSVLNFFKLAGITYFAKDTASLSYLFCAFFVANTNWLIVYDNASLTTTIQYELLKTYIPESDGHIIITSQIWAKVGGFKLLPVDNFKDSGDKGDDVLFIKKALKTTSLDRPATRLLSLCGAEPPVLTLTTSCIKRYDDLNCDTYLKLLDYYGAGALDNSWESIDAVAFDILSHRSEVFSKYYNDSFHNAVLELLIIISLFSSVDLILLSFAFSILPEPLLGILRDEKTRTKLIGEMSLYGLYLATPSLLQGNTYLCQLSSSHFNTPDKLKVFEEMLKKSEQIISSLQVNTNIDNGEDILSSVCEYIIRLYNYIIVYSSSDPDTLRSKYPFASKLFYEQTTLHTDLENI